MPAKVLDAIVDGFLWAVALLLVMIDDLKNFSEKIFRLKSD
jgi:hypothetical protein